MSSPDSGAPSPQARPSSTLKRNEGSSASATSLVSSTSEEVTPSGANNDGRLLSVVGKAKDRRRKSLDPRRSEDDVRRLSAFIPGRSRRKSLHKGMPTDLTSLQRHLGEQSTTSVQPNNRSDSSLGLAESSHSSQLTDGEDGSKKAKRPTISPHDSHAGLLTLSSPLFYAETQAISSANHNAVEPHAFGAHSTPAIPHLAEPRATEALGTPATNDRPTSASKKLKGAFALSRKKSDDSSATGKSGGSASFGSIFRPGSRRESVSPSDAATPEPATNIDKERPAEVGHTVLTPDTGAEPETPEKASSRVKRPLRINSTVSPARPSGITDTPTTLVTPPTPTLNSPEKGAFSSSPLNRPSSPAARSLSSIESIRHRRAQSGTGSSKLSSSTLPPLTPTTEEAKTPGGSWATQANNSGFFSTFFSAAQKAATQLTDTINIGGGPSNQKSNSPGLVDAGDNAAGEEITAGVETASSAEGVEKELAVQTLGQGDLSLSQLGIDESFAPEQMPAAADAVKQTGAAHDDSAAKAEQDAAAKAVSAAYDKTAEKATRQATGGRPGSIASNDRLTLNGDQTPSKTSDLDTPGALKRQGSVRSKISGRARRHRGSSATTGNTAVGAASASTVALTGSGPLGAGHRLTGFAVASSKRNKDFHSLFRSVPEDDYLIEDYSAALQRDILLHGRLYVSEGHICFSSNILGWVTNLVISFDEVVSVEKKSTAVIFPNALVISTLQARNTFASFVARDSTYELLIGIWKINHPNLKSSLNGVALDNAGTGDKTEKADSLPSGDESGSGSDEVYDEDADDDDMGSYTEADGGRSIAGSDLGEVSLARKASGTLANGQAQVYGAVSKVLDTIDAAVGSAVTGNDFPGPQSHTPTECSDSAEHYDRQLTDTTIPAPLGKVYSLMFGPASGSFMRKWLVEEQKSRDLDYVDDKTGLDNDHKAVTFSYIKPLNAPVGPKQTKCITQNTLEAFDLEKSVSVSCSTQTPDVPSGNVFTTKTRYCLMWGPDNSTRMIANCTIEWTGKSWLKGPIEKGAQDGQTQYVRDIVAALKAAVTSRPAVKATGKKLKKKGKKESLDAEQAQQGRDASAAAQQQSSSWGILEPIRGPLEPVVNTVKPFANTQFLIGFLIMLVLWQWLFAARFGGGPGLAGPGSYRHDHKLAYEEIWRQEESELWNWLQDRVGLEGIYSPLIASSDKQLEKQKAFASKNMGKRLESDKKMLDLEVDDAIRVTEERLQALKDAVARKKRLQKESFGGK